MHFTHTVCGCVSTVHNAVVILNFKSKRIFWIIIGWIDCVYGMKVLNLVWHSKIDWCNLHDTTSHNQAMFVINKFSVCKFNWLNDLAFSCNYMRNKLRWNFQTFLIKA